MSKTGARIDALIYGKVDIRQLETVGKTRETNPVTDYSDTEVFEMISWMEWFEPNSQELDVMQDDLLKNRKSIYKMLNDTLIGVYGEDKRTIQGANYFSIEYLNSTDLRRFLQDIGQKVKRRGIQKVEIPPTRSRSKIPCVFDALVVTPKEETKRG